MRIYYVTFRVRAQRLPGEVAGAMSTRVYSIILFEVYGRIKKITPSTYNKNRNKLMHTLHIQFQKLQNRYSLQGLVIKTNG